MNIYKETKIGIIAIIIIAFFIWGYSFLKGKNLLSTADTYYAVYENIDGLEEASPVYISGFKIGIVESLKLHPKKKDLIVVRFSLEEKVDIPVNTKAIIYPASLIAGKAIKLELSNNKELHSNNDTLIGILEKDLVSSLSDELIPVKNKIEDLVESIDAILIVFDEKRKENIQNSLQNIDDITSELNYMLDSDKSKINKILSNVESITSNLRNHNEQISNILENFSSISDSLDQANIKSTIVNANKTLAEFSEISQKINRGEGTVGMLINNDSLYNNLNNLAADLDSLIVDLNENPKKYVHFSLFGKKDK